MAETTLAPTRRGMHAKRLGESTRLVAPTPDAFVDAQAVTFEWLDGEGPYTLEVARDADFKTVVARVPTGTSTTVTVYDLFRPDGTQYYWRVASAAAYCTPRAFVAGTQDQLSKAPERELKAAAARSPRGSGATVEELAPLYRTGTTSRGLIVSVALLIVVSFLATLLLLFRMSTQL